MRGKETSRMTIELGDAPAAGEVAFHLALREWGRVDGSGARPAGREAHRGLRTGGDGPVCGGRRGNAGGTVVHPGGSPNGRNSRGSGSADRCGGQSHSPPAPGRCRRIFFSRSDCNRLIRNRGVTDPAS
ncbi:MAG: hypothetical protein MZV64_29625 [Ignavibacteriales bacterium]|nr:hypothetical protein [Ignavibacteriales bacterium]